MDDLDCDVCGSGAFGAASPLFLKNEGRLVWLTDHFPPAPMRHVLPGRADFALSRGASFHPSH
jgi:hypothetical protein